MGSPPLAFMAPANLIDVPNSLPRKTLSAARRTIRARMMPSRSGSSRQTYAGESPWSAHARCRSETAGV